MRSLAPAIICRKTERNWIPSKKKKEHSPHNDFGAFLQVSIGDGTGGGLEEQLALKYPSVFGALVSDEDSAAQPPGPSGPDNVVTCSAQALPLPLLALPQLLGGPV